MLLRMERKMRHKNLVLIAILALMLISVGCQNSTKSNNNNNPEIEFSDLQIDDSFGFATVENVNVELRVANGDNDGVEKIPFKIYDKDPQEGGRLLDSGSTKSNGVFSSRIVVPTYIKSIFVEGYMSSLEIPINNGYAMHEFGSNMFNSARANKDFISPEKSTLTYLSPYNADGVPDNMSFEAVPAGFLSKVNNALPERISVPDNNPHFLYEGNEFNAVIINQSADIWITFVHEGAGHKNVFGFYTFDVNNPPETTDDIAEITVAFPNVSMVGSGGGLVPGDKVYLGEFEPGTAIGWVLMANGWRNGVANLVTDTWYSDKELNHTGQQQSVLFYDDEYEKLVVGFEDLDFGEGDDDFNDALFFVSSEPTNSIDTSEVTPMGTPSDEDGDGIPDMFDDFPQDPERAFHTNNHSMSTLAFEDLWPQKGDYDFNDLVVDYNIFFHKDADNKIKNVITEFELRAVGARYRNGFAVQFPFESSNIESYNIIDGSDNLTYSNIISDLNFAPQLETGTKATVVYVDNTLDLIQPVGDTFINTEKNVTYLGTVKFALDIKLSNPENISDWQWNVPFNPFIYVDRDRSHEIHLPDFPPTDLVNPGLFGTSDDSSLISQNRYYKSVENHPWVLNIADSWDYPYEKNKVTGAYLLFKDWAESSGNLYPDWYKDLPGYRNSERIYQEQD